MGAYPPRRASHDQSSARSQLLWHTHAAARASLPPARALRCKFAITRCVHRLAAHLTNLRITDASVHRDARPARVRDAARLTAHGY